MFDKIAEWWSNRLDRPRLCAYGESGFEDTEPRCEKLITLRSSAAAGHRGYCSHHHAALAQVDAPM